MSPIVICIALFVVMLVLFFTNKIPMSFTALAAMVALVLFGCLDSSAALPHLAATRSSPWPPCS